MSATARTPFGDGSICFKPYVCDGPARDRVDDLLGQAHGAAAAGFDGITISEHHLGFPGYFPNPLQAATWILERTAIPWAAPAPMLPLLRPTRLVAEEIAWLAALHPGRIGAGFAAGSIAADFALADTDQDDLTGRFEASLGELSSILRGDVPAELHGDPAFVALAQAPVPVVSAASSHTACRRAARVGCGVLLESAVAPEEIRRLIATYRKAGGSGPTVLVRRVWVGDRPPTELERQRDDLVRSTVPAYNRDSWMPPEQMIMHGTSEQLVAQLLDVVQLSGASALNLRVHVPGLSGAQVLEQIAALTDVLGPLRDAWDATRS